MTKKKITAPLSYDPGKGRPKEYLAYLNWQEMQALQRLNGGNMERGPMGLPSFPPDWAGPGNTQTASGSWQGTSSVNSGSGAGTGGGSDSGTNVGSSGTTTPSSSAPNAAAAAAASKLAEQESADAAARQAAETRAAAEAARNSALSEDAAKGGIRSINVGPQQTPVQFAGGQITGTIAGLAQATSQMYGQPTTPSPVSTVAGTMTAPIPRMNPLNDPSKFIQQEKDVFSGVNPTALSRIVRLQEQYGSPLTITSGVRSPSENVKRGGAKKSQHIHGNAIDIAIPGASAAETANLIDIASGVGFSGIGGYRPGKVHVDVGSQRVWGPSYGGESISSLPKQMQTALRSHMAGTTPKININYADLENAPGKTVEVRLAETEDSYNPGVISDPIASAGINALTRLASGVGGINLPSIPEAPQAQKSALAFAQKVMPEAAYQAMVNKAVAEATSGFSLADQFSTGIGALKQALGPPQTQFAGKPYQERLMTTDGVTREVKPEQITAMDPADRARIDAYQQAQRYATNQYGITDEKTPVQTVNADDFVGPTYVTPEQQALIDEQERINRYGIEGMQKIGPGGSIVSGVENIYKMITGNDIADAATDLKNRYMQAGPAEREELRNKYPDMRRFAVSIGDIPPNAGTQYASYGSGSYRPELGNKGNDFPYYGGERYYASLAEDQPVQARRKRKSQDQYSLWDQGIDIPSPGDPDYNDYQEYLAQKGDSAEV